MKAQTTPAFRGKTQHIDSMQYSELVPVLAQYRNSMKEFAGITTKRYAQIYTERRTAGARSKFWMSNSDAAVWKRAKRYAQANPFIVVGKAVYKVDLKTVQTADWRHLNDIALYANRVL